MLVSLVESYNQGCVALRQPVLYILEPYLQENWHIFGHFKT